MEQPEAVETLPPDLDDKRYVWQYTKNFVRLYWKSLFLIIWPLCLTFIMFGPWIEGASYFNVKDPISGENEPARFEHKYMYRTMYIFVVMSGFWLTECIPIHVTGLIPLFAFPLMNVLSSEETTALYLKGSNMTFITSIWLALAVEYSQLHQRIAYGIVLLVGTDPRKMHLGVLIATYLLSMWLLNTATAAMMCPIVKAVIETFEQMGIGSFYRPLTEKEKETGEEPQPSKVTVAYYLGVCYAASIGGLGTMIGTGTTLLYKGIIETRFGKAPVDIVSFLHWTAFGTPVFFLVNIANWFLLQKEKETGEEPQPSKVTVAYYLGVCYAASIGGLGTIIGTGTTLLYKGIIETRFGKAPVDIVSFLHWTAFGTPVFFLVNIANWFLLQIIYFGMFRPNSPEGQYVAEAKMKKDIAKETVKQKMRELGKISWHEIWVLCIFLSAILLMVFRKPDIFPGWSDALWLYGPGDFAPNRKWLKEPVILTLAIILLLVIPATPDFLYSFSRDKNRRPKKNASGLVTWKVLHTKSPWGMVFLIGGGACLATAGNKTKMTNLIGTWLLFLRSVNRYVVMALTTFAMLILTQFASNMTAVNMLIPIVNELSVALRSHPRFLGHPAGMAASLSFMLPVSTTTNVVAAAYANVRSQDFIRGGGLLALASYVITLLCFVTYGRLIWGAMPYPEWADA